MASRDVVDQAVLSAVATVGFFNVFAPNLIEARANQSDQDIEHLRASYRPAIGLTLALGLGLSLIVKSPLPILTAASTATVMVGIYEHTLPPQKRLLSSSQRRLSNPAIIDSTWRPATED